MKTADVAICALALVTAFATQVLADQFDGLYQPSGSDWSCSSEHIGMDGGALAIMDGYLEGVENRCELTSPRAIEDGTLYTALCSGEGESYSEFIVLSLTNDGLLLQRGDHTVEWTRCEARQAHSSSRQPTNGRWTFGARQGIVESATRDSNGNSVTFVCSDVGTNGGLYVELGGEPIRGGGVDFDIDGKVIGMVAWGRGGDINTECRACSANYRAIWEAAAAGNLMTITASDGRSAAFSLLGSREALGETPCAPAYGY